MSKECGLIANIRGAIIYNCYNLDSVRGGYQPVSSEKNCLYMSQNPLAGIIDEGGKSRITGSYFIWLNRDEVAA